MTPSNETRRAGGAAGPGNTSLPGGIDDGPSIAPETAPAQENLLLGAIKALSAEEIRAAALENIPLMLAASGWRSTAAMLTYAAGCADAGVFFGAERNRQRARELFIEGNDAFRQFMEARSAHALGEAYQ
jgi:hypothetical protein